MKSLLRRWLGYDEAFAEVSLHLLALQEEILELRNDLVVTFRDEFDPKRKEMSDRLGQKMIEKLNAEDLARKHTQEKSNEHL